MRNVVKDGMELVATDAVPRDHYAGADVPRAAAVSGDGVMTRAKEEEPFGFRE
jgi:hypothetical protein